MVFPQSFNTVEGCVAPGHDHMTVCSINLNKHQTNCSLIISVSSFVLPSVRHINAAELHLFTKYFNDNWKLSECDGVIAWQKIWPLNIHSLLRRGGVRNFCEEVKVLAVLKRSLETQYIWLLYPFFLETYLNCHIQVITYSILSCLLVFQRFVIFMFTVYCNWSFKQLCLYVIFSHNCKSKQKKSISLYVWVFQYLSLCEHFNKP